MRRRFVAQEGRMDRIDDRFTATNQKLAELTELTEVKFTAQQISIDQLFAAMDEKHVELNLDMIWSI
jgi:transcription-repair coupling factor (superfamily II helicase)